MGNRKRHSVAPLRHGGRRYQSGTIRIGHRVGLGQALAAALEPFGLGVAIIEPGTLRILFVSEALAALLGTTAEELVALRSLLERVVPQDARAAETCFGTSRPSELTLRLVHACGDPIDLDLSVRPFNDESLDGDSGESAGANPTRKRRSPESPPPRALAVVFRGVGERRERESLRVAVGEAAESLRARDELFSMATHEIRTPLTSLRLHAQALLRGLMREPPDLARARRAVVGVERQAERISMLADHLLDVSRIRSGRLEIERSRTDLGSVIRDVATRFGAEAAALGATIIIDGEPSVTGHWDSVRLEQIVANLISNALKFGEGKPIALELRSIGARALLTVRDHGPGIPEDEQARIFEPFERAKHARGTKGAGLGLWIVRRLVEAHGGTVRLASVVGRGTVLAVDLPRDEEPGDVGEPE
jgi:nitrogen-specific signal transduction histidine kinase